MQLARVKGTVVSTNKADSLMGLKLLGGFFTAMGGSGATLSVALYIYAMERGKFDVAFAVAAVLMLIVLIVNFAAKRLGRRLKNNQ